MFVFQMLKIPSKFLFSQHLTHIFHTLTLIHRVPACIIHASVKPMKQTNLTRKRKLKRDSEKVRDIESICGLTQAKPLGKVILKIRYYLNITVNSVTNFRKQEDC